MENIILPQVSILNEINDSTNLMVEQNGEINRYPISDLDITEDQVVMDDGRRLSGTNFLSIDKEGSSFAEPNPINADTLDGKLASEYATNDFVNEKVKKAAPRNLLDNSDFRNPVNQRGIQSGITTINAWSYHLDRWRTAGEEQTITFDSNGIIASNTLCQVINNLYPYLGKKMTVACGFSNGDIYTSSGIINDYNSWTTLIYLNIDVLEMSVSASSSGLWEIRFSSRGNKIAWAALYEGEYTAETLPRYQPKGYGAELAECQRYYYQVASLECYGYGGAYGEFAYTMLLPVEMRIAGQSVTYGTIALKCEGTDISSKLNRVDKDCKKNRIRLSPVTLQTGYTNKVMYAKFTNLCVSADL